MEEAASPGKWNRAATLNPSVRPEQKFNNILMRVEKFLYDNKMGVQTFYEYIDTSRDKQVSKSEFIEKVQKHSSLGFRKPDAEEFFDYVDNDKNGYLSY